MGLLDILKSKSAKKKSQITWEESILSLNSEEITLQEFINMNASHPLYYSTPAGENKDGKTVLWLLNNKELNMNFYPVYTSESLCMQSLTSLGRVNFIIIKGTLESALAALDTNSVLRSAGLLIQDGKGRLPIPPKMRVQK